MIRYLILFVVIMIVWKVSKICFNYIFLDRKLESSKEIYFIIFTFILSLIIVLIALFLVGFGYI